MNIEAAASRQLSSSSLDTPRRSANSGSRPAVSAAACKFARAPRFVKTLLSANAEYSSGPVVDAEVAVMVVGAGADPHPGGLHEQLAALLRRKLVVARRVEVAANRVSDVAVDVQRGRARRPIARALLAADRAPRKRRAA